MKFVLYKYSCMRGRGFSSVTCVYMRTGNCFERLNQSGHCEVYAVFLRVFILGLLIAK